MTRLRVGVVGAGRRVHEMYAPVLSALRGDFEVVGAASRTPASARRATIRATSACDCAFARAPIVFTLLRIGASRIVVGDVDAPALQFHFERIAMDPEDP